MGHSDISVTMNTCTHLGLEDAAAEMKRLEEVKRARMEQERMDGPYSQGEDDHGMAISPGEIDDPMTQKMRQPDKLIDELTTGKPMEKVLNTALGTTKNILRKLLTYAIIGHHIKGG